MGQFSTSQSIRECLGLINAKNKKTTQFKTKVMAIIKINCHILRLMFNWYVFFSFCNTRTIFSWDIAHSTFKLEISRSRSRPKSTQTLEWRHNERDGVSNHQPHDCLLNRLFRRRCRKHQSSTSLAFMRGIHHWPVNSPHKGPVTRNMFPFDDSISSVGDRHISYDCDIINDVTISILTTGDFPMYCLYDGLGQFNQWS